jgi:site-specific DNA recombinase
VAIYTRKSTDEGLDQEFNSLDAQRQAVEAYVLSQRGEGWTALPERYDDGGYTGANTDRPAFQRLFRDVEAGKVDVVAVYKIDRLSRSLLDFARIMEVFERRGVTFVSITQQFNTTTSMGKLTLNILMSFAEFERQTISERTRDKMAATRRKGMWTGGRPVLGYDVVSKRLVVNQAEAEKVREVFCLYQDLGSVIGVVEELRRRGWTTKNGKGAYGKPAVRSLLTNALYIGKVEYRGELFDAPHEPIVDQNTWDAVQRHLHQPTRRPYRAPTNQCPALLRGLVHCGACGATMTPHYAQKRGRRWGYYVCLKHQKEGAAACPGSRVSLTELEAFVVEKIQSIGKEPRLVAETIKAAKRALQARKPELEAEIGRLREEERRLEGERENIIAAIRQGGTSTITLTAELAKTDEALAEAVGKVDALRGEIEALESQVIDESDLREALARFEPVWGELFPAERARILQLLIEAVSYDARAEEMTIRFRPGGVRVLAKEARNDE